MRLVLTYEALALSVMTAMYFSTLEAIQNRTFWQMVGAPWLVKNQQILQKTSFKDFMLDLIARNSSNLLVAWLVDPQDWPPTRIRVGGESWESPGSPGLYGKIPWVGEDSSWIHLESAVSLPSLLEWEPLDQLPTNFFYYHFILL